MRKGSITVYLSLLLLLLLSLLAAALYSARVAAGRAVLSSGTEQGMYSLFAQYDRELYDKYGLLFFDAGYGRETLQLSELPEIVQEYAAYTLEGQESTGFLFGSHILDASLVSSSLDSYTLATDAGGAAFQRQVCQIMQKSLGTSGVKALISKLQRNHQAAEEPDSYSMGDAEADYEQMLDTAALQTEAGGAAGESENTGETDPEAGGDSGDTAEQTNFPDTVSAGAETENSDAGQEQTAAADGSTESPASGDFVNPIDTIRKLREMGVLTQVMTDPSEISSYTLSSGQMLSERNLQQGMGVVADTEDGTTEKLLLLEYLAEKFPCYTSEKKESGLQYQVEYVIAGKKSDRENLKKTVEKLLLLREALNMVYLLTDAEASAQAETLALTIAAALAIPAAADGIALILKAAWAYGESLLDLRELMDGGKIALLKDSSSWQLPLSSLVQVQEQADSLRHSSSSGLDYSWYLRILLMGKNERELTAGLMDLTEHNMRTGGNYAGFSLDCCVDSAEITLDALLGGNACSITRSYGYGITS